MYQNFNPAIYDDESAEYYAHLRERGDWSEEMLTSSKYMNLPNPWDIFDAIVAVTTIQRRYREYEFTKLMVTGGDVLSNNQRNGNCIVCGTGKMYIEHVPASYDRERVDSPLPMPYCLDVAFIMADSDYSSLPLIHHLLFCEKGTIIAEYDKREGHCHIELLTLWDSRHSG